jgi:hypothetical protein
MGLAFVLAVALAGPAPATPRLQAAQTFVNSFSRELGIQRPPRVAVTLLRPGVSGYYERKTNRLLVSPSFSSLRGGKARFILSHETLHAWQNETGFLRFNLPGVGHYIEAPAVKNLRDLVIHPVKIAQALAYAFQPVELHAVLSGNLVRPLLGLLPPKPW